MEKEKKKWETPKFICLYRGRSEEAVLTTCKTNKGGGINTATGNCGSNSCNANQTS